ncbi:ATP-binding cassette domain-containing protein [Streptomyces curacoi]|uniref:ABC transporter ATP-binding protein n=1 Tax=Streptomyces curacoi TaxID=146536 RepID=A0A124H2D8_9ACTN|nr:ABC transporter ATP-binding protein [Streptomyces curacoi]KUM76085.1 hypothetical protein AQI70_16030 [Streptomyces curacoi]
MARNPLPTSSERRTRRTGDRLLWQSVSRRRTALAALVAALLLELVSDLVLPLALAHALDSVIHGRQTATSLILLAGTLVLAASSEVAIQFADPYTSAAGVAELRRRAVRHWLCAGAGLTRRHRPGDVVTRMVAGAGDTAGSAVAFARTVTSLLGAVGGLVALGLIDLWLPLTVLVALPVAVVMMRTFVRGTAELAGDYQLLQGDIMSRLLDALRGARTIRACDTAEQEVERTLVPLADLHRAGASMWAMLARVSWQATLLGPFVSLSVLAVAGFGVSAGRVTPGQLAAVVSYAGLVLGALDHSRLLARLARARAATGRIADLLSLPGHSYGHQDLRPGHGSLRLREVTVDVDGRRVLRDVDLDVPAGSSVALVGRTGSGKSALAAVAGRLLEPSHGTVLMDGVPMQLLSRQALRSAVSYAFARPVLLGGTVAGAIGLGSEPASARHVRAGARAARADGFIKRLPAGYDNVIRHTPLSGGETQRLGLARAFARNARLLILDDATSSLDTATEHEVHQALDDPALRRTRLLIARRPATAARADLVAWLEEGRIRAVAPHQDLWAEPAYRAVFQPTQEPGPAAPPPAGQHHAPRKEYTHVA